MLWRVTQRQSIVIRGGEVRSLLIMVMEAALNRAKDILNGEHEECNHNPVNVNDSSLIRDQKWRVGNFSVPLLILLEIYGL